MVRHILTAILAITLAMLVPPLIQGGAHADMEQAFSSSQHNGPCRLSVKVRGAAHYRGVHSRGYVAKDSAVHQERIDFQIRHKGAACPYVVQIESANGGTPRMMSRGDALEYRILGNQGQTNTDGVSTELSGYFGNGRGQSDLSFLIEVPAAQNVRAGHYKDDLVLSIYDDTDGMMQILSSRSINLHTHVHPSVTASIGSDAHAGLKATSVEFGNMHQGKTRSVGFAVDANTMYDISLESENGGALKHFVSDDEVAYAVKVDGAPISSEDLEAGATIIRGATSSVHDLEIEIVDDIGLAVAGRYDDQLTIVITAE